MSRILTRLGKEIQVTVKDLIRPLPGVRQFSLLRQRIGFRGSARYWERNYARGGTSGPGSYNALAEAKAAFLNDFVRTRQVRSVIEFGCGDGHQLSLADYPAYIGLDVSRSAIELCKRRFAGDTGNPAAAEAASPRDHPRRRKEPRVPGGPEHEAGAELPRR